MKACAALLLLLATGRALAGPFSPAAGQPGSDAVPAIDPRIVAWATGVSALTRGLVDISDSQSPLASFGSAASALGPANAYDFDTGLPSTSPSTVVSLGDGGSITLTFASPLHDAPGPDFAVFENAFNDSFLELAFVEVSSDGVHFERFPAISLTQTDHQIAQDSAQFNAIDPTDVNGLAGKYRAGYGTPFDLGVLAGRPLLDIQNILAVRVIDVVGALDPLYASYDSSAPPHPINDPWPTPFSTSGFDLDAVAVLQPTPEPGSAVLLAAGAALLAMRRRTGRALRCQRSRLPPGVFPSGAEAKRCAQRGRMTLWQAGIGAADAMPSPRSDPADQTGPSIRLRSTRKDLPRQQRRPDEILRPDRHLPAGEQAPREAPGAFTLIELLVALTIIVVLAALVLGAVNVARGRGDAAQCVSNLRELATANLCYAAEHEGYYVPAQDPTNTIRWHGLRTSTGGKFDPNRGPLAPYLGADGRVKLCPALRRVLTGKQSFEDGTGGYGYNATYIGGTPLDPFTPELLSKVPRPGTTLMFADCAFPRADGLQEYAYAEPWQWVDYAGRPRGPLAPSVHFRHGGYANVVWCDGHVAAEAPSKLGGRNSYGGDAEKWVIGWFGEPPENGVWNPQRTQP